MPRGNTSDNKLNSPVIGDKGILASAKELNSLTANMRENFLKDLSRPPIDLKDPEQVKQAIYNYLLDCEQAGKRPGNMGLYRALDMTRQDINNIFNGKLKNKVSPACMDIIKKALSMLSEYREQLAIQGKLNPVTLIFWQKNFDGLRDQTEIQLSADTSPAAALSPDEIQARIEKDIPVDTDYKEL